MKYNNGGGGAGGSNIYSSAYSSAYSSNYNSAYNSSSGFLGNSKKTKTKIKINLKPEFEKYNINSTKKILDRDDIKDYIDKQVAQEPVKHAVEIGKNSFPNPFSNPFSNPVYTPEDLQRSRDDPFSNVRPPRLDTPLRRDVYEHQALLDILKSPNKKQGTLPPQTDANANNDKFNKLSEQTIKKQQQEEILASGGRVQRPRTGPSMAHKANPRINRNLDNPTQTTQETITSAFLQNANSRQRNTQLSPTNLTQQYSFSSNINHLFKCIKANDFDSLKIFLTQERVNININGKNEEGKTPLIKAIEQNNLDIFTLLLLQKGIYNNFMDNENYSPLYYAIQSNNLDIVKLLLEHGEKTENNININGYINFKTPLIYAIEKGNIDVIELLIKKGSNVNLGDDKKKTPLIYAIDTNNIDIITLLLEKGANPVTTYNSKTPLKYAQEKYAQENKKNREEDEEKAEEPGYIAIIKTLTEAEKNSPDDENNKNNFFGHKRKRKHKRQIRKPKKSKRKQNKKSKRKPKKSKRKQKRKQNKKSKRKSNTKY